MTGRRDGRRGSPARAAAAPRKRPHGLETREALIGAAVELLLEKGADAVKTGDLADRAGVVQSGFYAHFDSVEACVIAATERIAASVKTIVGHWQQNQLLAEQLAAPASVAPTRRHFRQVIALLAEQRRFVEVLLVRRHEPTALGRAVARIHRDLVAQVGDYLLQLGAPWGVGPQHRRRLDAHAGLIVGATIEASRLAIAPSDLTRSADALADQVFFGALALFARCANEECASGRVEAGRAQIAALLRAYVEAAAES